MRKQIAAANWKMNTTYQAGEKLLSDILASKTVLKSNQQAVFAVPSPYLVMANSKLDNQTNYFISAQNCYQKKSGAFTGEISAEMLQSIDIKFCVVGHSERREYFHETNKELAEKVSICLEYGITPIFCCGEPLSIRESGSQNKHVEQQLKESLFHLSEDDIQKVVIAYEPIWAIGTGKTASADQAQEMHAHLRAVVTEQYSLAVAANISILYGGSVKGSNAAEIFSKEDVDGGLVGGASLNADEFVQIIKALK
jgi:triosephosphate isomerase